MKYLVYVSKILCLLITISICSNDCLYAQPMTAHGSSSGAIGDDDDDWKKILQNLNTLPSSGHDPDLMVARVWQSDLSNQPLHLATDFNPNMQTPELHRGNRTPMSSYSNQERNTTRRMSRERATPNIASNVLGYIPLEIVAALHHENVLTLSARQPIAERRGSLLLKSPEEVNFVANEVVMQRSRATASFKVQKGKSYVVKIHTRMSPSRRGNQVSLNVDYSLGGGSTVIDLSKSAIGGDLQPYEFQLLLLADGSGYINLNIQRNEGSGKWAFSKVEIQEVHF